MTELRSGENLIKFAEMYAAFALEKELSKQEIFELYANSIYFGSGHYSIAAAQAYFNKDVSELSGNVTFCLF